MSEESPSSKKLLPVILAGGNGRRMLPLTQPKCLTQLLGVPIIEWSLSRLDIPHEMPIVCVGYRAEEVIKQVGNGGRVGAVEFSVLGEGVGMLKRLQQAARGITADLILIMCGDTFADIDFQKLVDFHISHGEQATMVVRNLRSEFGVVDVDFTGAVTCFREKPVLSTLINTGYILCNASALPDDSMDDMVEFIYQLVAGGMATYLHDGFYITITTANDVYAAEQEMKAWVAKKQESLSQAEAASLLPT